MKNYYLVYEVMEIDENEFKNKNWDISKLEGYKLAGEYGLPFSVTLTKLMHVLKKEIDSNKLFNYKLFE